MEKLKTKINKLYNKNYKFLLLIPAILLILSLVYLGYFYNKHQDFIIKDVSLKGGTTITIYPEKIIDIKNLEEELNKNLEDFNLREISEFATGKQTAVIIKIPLENSNSLESDLLIGILENYLEYDLIIGENLDMVSTGSSLGKSFYNQLIYAVILSFSFMSIVVLFIFGESWKIKLLFLFIIFLPVILFFSGAFKINLAIGLSAIFLILSVLIFLKINIPSAAVVISAFADIIMTLAIVDLLSIKLSGAGIIAFLMLIGYSVDTDIMLTARLLKRQGNINHKLKNAFKTGVTMGFTSILAIAAALIITSSFSEVLKQIFTILIIGLSFDLINTWMTNASILKWYLEIKEKIK